MRTRRSSRSLWLRALSFGFLLAFLAVAHPEHVAADDIGSYPLDGLPRVLPVGAPLPCDQPLVSYRGERVRYRKGARVHEAFVARLRAFEEVLVHVAIKHYGRAPRMLTHMGTQSCRRMRLYPTWVSEHALGNGIDVASFDFAALPRAGTAPAGLPAALRRGFSVSVLDHWSSRSRLGAVHSAFLQDLAQALIDRQDIFRVLLGPAYPGHKNHFHFDCAPYRVVDIF
jgi:hypothetical protein